MLSQVLQALLKITINLVILIAYYIINIYNVIQYANTSLFNTKIK